MLELVARVGELGNLIACYSVLGASRDLSVDEQRPADDGGYRQADYDEARVAVVTRAAIGANGTKTFDQRYPAAGTPNVAVTLWLMDPDGGRRAKVDLGSNADIYLARVDWAIKGSASSDCMTLRSSAACTIGQVQWVTKSSAPAGTRLRLSSVK